MIRAALAPYFISMETNAMTDIKPKDKLEALRGIIRDMKGAVLAYSGGVDSSFLLKVAREELGDNLLAVTAVSDTYSKDEHREAIELAAALGARHKSIHTEETNDPCFAANPPERCYHCKKELFGKLRVIAEEEGVEIIMDASNVDDNSDYRPGRIAAGELNVRSPLIEAGITKDDIRLLSRELNLPTWDKPAMACLASRFPYGETITPEKLGRCAAAERALHDAGFRLVRVRSHGDIARIEIDPDKISELIKPEVRTKIVAELKKAGFAYVALDLQGYRAGSMNETLAESDRMTRAPSAKK